MTFEVRRKQRDGATVLELVGHLDFNNSGALEGAVDSAFENGTRLLIVDCSELSFISSSGLSTLLVGSKTFAEAGGKLVLCGVRGSIRRVMDISGFSSILELRETQEEAAGA